MTEPDIEPEVPQLEPTGSRRPEHWARATPEFPAVVDGDEVLTYAEWNRLADRLADALVRLHAPVPRAAVRTHQCLEWFVINLALNKARWEQIAVNWRLTPAETVGVLADSEPAVLFFDDVDPVPLIDACAASGVRLVSLRSADPRATTYDELCGTGIELPRYSRANFSLVTYSSGTTGRPKGTRKQAPRDEEHRQRINQYVASSPVKRPRARSRTLLTLPLHHGAGPKAARTCHNAGGTTYLLDRYDPVRALELIERHRITHWKCVPTMLQRMRGLPPEVLASFDVSSIRAVSVGSAATPWALKEWVMDYFGEVLHEGYGASEIGIVTVMRPEKHREKPGSCGRLRPHVEVRVVGPDGSELPRGADGELLIRTPITISGYLNPDSGENDRITPDGFFRTGDIGRLDEDNFLYITGRAKDMIIAGGVNIYPTEVENALSSHPDVLEVAVIGIPEPTFGEQVMAFCELRPGSPLTAEELIRFVEPSLAPFKRPRRIEFVTDFPRNALGKIVKNELRAPYWAGRAEGIPG